MKTLIDYIESLENRPRAAYRGSLQAVTLGKILYKQRFCDTWGRSVFLGTGQRQEYVVSLRWPVPVSMWTVRLWNLWLNRSLCASSFDQGKINFRHVLHFLRPSLTKYKTRFSDSGQCKPG